MSSSSLYGLDTCTLQLDWSRNITLKMSDKLVVLMNLHLKFYFMVELTVWHVNWSLFNESAVPSGLYLQVPYELFFSVYQCNEGRNAYVLMNCTNTYYKGESKIFMRSTNCTTSSVSTSSSCGGTSAFEIRLWSVRVPREREPENPGS